jgi:dUTP pyrophosphatase
MKVKIINKSNFELPEYKTSGSVGMDLQANIKNEIHIYGGNTILIPTGIHIQLPDGYEAQVRPRSGLSLKQQLVATLGTIDSDYIGEIGVIINNTGKGERIIKPGDRIAQLVFAKVEKCEWNLVEELEETERGEGGFGSTGV